jgi:hypothetical protein
MSFLDRLRKMLAGPPQIQGGGEGGAGALDEEYGTPDKAAPDARHAVEAATQDNTHWHS